MHVLYILPKPAYFAEGRRGRVAHAIGVATGLAAGGVNVTVLSGPGAADACGRSEGITVVEIPWDRGAAESGRRWLRELLRTADELLRNTDIDTVLVRYAVSNGRVMSRLMRAHPELGRCFEVNSLAYHQLHRLPVLFRNMIRRAEMRALRYSDLVYTVSHPVAADLRLKESTRAVVVPNAGHRQPEGRVGEAGDAGKPLRFVYMGVLQRHYELSVLAEAFRMVRKRKGAEVELHVYGDGPLYDQMARLFEGDEGGELHGRYDLDSLLSAGVLDRRTVLVLPCRADGTGSIVSPIKLFEYMSFGLPIIASDVPQVASALKNDVTAALYRPGDSGSLALAMERIAADQGLRSRLGESVLREFLRNHTWERRMATLIRELESVRKTKKPCDGHARESALLPPKTTKSEGNSEEKRIFRH